MSSKDEVGEKTFRGVESESENFYHLELETESKSEKFHLFGVGNYFTGSTTLPDTQKA